MCAKEENKEQRLNIWEDLNCQFEEEGDITSILAGKILNM